MAVPERVLDYAVAYEPYVMGADNVVLYYDSGVVSSESTSFGSVKRLFR